MRSLGIRRRIFAAPAPYRSQYTDRIKPACIHRQSSDECGNASARERHELAGTKLPCDLVEHGVDHPGLVPIDEGIGDVDVFGDDDARWHVAAMTKLVGARAQQDRKSVVE